MSKTYSDPYSNEVENEIGQTLHPELSFVLVAQEYLCISFENAFTLNLSLFMLCGH